MNPHRRQTIITLVLQAALLGAIFGMFGGVAIVALP